MIRKAALGDANAVWEIFHEVVQEGDTFVFDPETTKEAGLAYWMGEDKHCYVYEHEGEVAGTFIIKDNQPDLGSHVANASFMVSPRFQGRSIGKKIGQGAISEAKKLGYKAMQFNIVISTNERAVNLWESLGFNVVGTVPEAYHHQKLDQLVDIYIMYRKL